LTDPKNDFAGSIGAKIVGPGELYLLPAGKSGHAGMDKNVYVLLIVDGRCNMQSLLQRRLFFL